MPNYDGRHDQPIKALTDAMKVKLMANRHKGDGAEWDKIDPETLLSRIEGEVVELRAAIAGGNTIEILMEAADVSNFVMIAAWGALMRLHATPK